MSMTPPADVSPPDDYGATVRQWTDIIRRAELTPAVKGVAFLLATYADANGRRIFPGVATLSVASGRDYRTIRRALKELTDVGLLEKLVSRSGVRGKADEYRLILAPDLLDRLAVMSPTLFVAKANAIREANRRNARSTGQGDPVPNAVSTGHSNPVLTEELPVSTGREAPAKRRGTGQGTPAVRGRGHSNTSHSEIATRSTSHSDSGLRTEVTVSRARAPAEEPLPEKCVHGLAARLLSNGTSSCVLCRRAAKAINDAPNVIPIRRGA